MPTLQNLYQIYKISSTTIVDSNMCIENYTIRKAMRDGCLVSVGDNAVFSKIREYYQDYRSHVEIFNIVQSLRKTLKMCKHDNQFREAQIVEQQISDILFVKDIIVVTCEKKGDYKKVGLKGFSLNGIRFTRLCAGAGNLRRNCAIYVNEELYPYLYEHLMCGLSTKLKEAVLTKLGAYFALSFSSVLWVRTPRVCVTKDFETTLKNQKVDYICKDTVEGEHGHKVEKHYIEERTMDLVLNSADGQGLVDPKFGELWAEDMHLDYIPSSFVVRSSFVKGNLVPFDFKEYARENGITKIKDKWGVEYDVEDVDVILSESQFKMHKEYTSWQEYLYYFNKYNLKWGVSRYNKKHDDEWTLANYQYIQTLDLTRDEIGELVQPTVDWFNKICSGDLSYTLLFMLGSKDEDAEYYDMYGTAQTNFMKAVVKSNAMLQDGYVQSKIYKNIVECINRAKIGKIWVRGNYQFMISDPIAQCRSALGLEPKGEVPADCIWSNFWNERGVTGTVDVCRSPQIDAHEHCPSTLYKSEETEKWFKYIHSGVVLSIYDTATFRISDADFDGDIVLTSDNKYFIKGSHKDQNIITYNKGMAKKEAINRKTFIKKDLMGFGTAVGSFSNTATILYSMIGIFNKPEQESQRKELYTRIKLLREYVGQEIDRAKLGIKQPQLPAEWKKHVKINPDDTDDVKADKYRHNSMVISKKPYFFRYLYPELNKQYKLHESNYNIICKDMFGIKLKKLIASPNKTEEQKNLIRRYQKYSPLIVSNCVMNILCKHFEDIDFDIKFRRDGKNLLPLYEDCGYICDDEILKIFRTAYREFNNKKNVKMLDDLFAEHSAGTSKDVYFTIRDYLRDEIRSKVYALGLSSQETMFYIGCLSKEYSKFNWSFAWDVLGDNVIDVVEYGDSYVPVRTTDEDGIEYLGSKYKMKDVGIIIDDSEESELLEN